MIPFSDAILLGSTILKPKPLMFWDGKDSGCALGMAFKALGVEIVISNFCVKVDIPKDIQAFLEKRATPPDCGCEPYSIGYCTVDSVIVHIFDSHVCNYKDWTLERLVDWVGSQEVKALPAAPEEVNELVAA